jgi:N-acylglucosamine 2-epimerase
MEKKMIINKLEEYRNIYKKNLTESVIPFWYKNSPDWEHGGTYSCLDRDGSVYDSKKYIWLVGRSAWMFSRLYNEFDKTANYLDVATLGINYLQKYAMDGQGRYYFSLTQEGKPWFYQRKPYGAVFAMLAYLEYCRATGNEKFRKEAVQLFWKITEWIDDSTKLGRPSMEGVPPMSNLANIMVLASMAIELARVDDDPRYKEIMKHALEGCKRHFDPALKVLIENVPFNEKVNSRQWPEGRSFNPGHSIEVAWFILHMVRFIPDKQMLNLALEVLEGSLNLGWDKEYGGLYYFMDIEGKPTLQLESNMKLWWPHTEAIYASVLAFSLTKDPKWIDWLEKVHKYSFEHFVDWKYGEWFGYCDQHGNVSNLCKGGNYKGFFHVPRALLFSIQEIDKCLKEI